MIGRGKYGLDWLNAALDWGEYRNVPVTPWRDNNGEWCVSLAFRDSRGIFYSEPLRMPEQVTASAVKSVERSLEKLSIEARKGRIRLTAVV